MAVEQVDDKGHRTDPGAVVIGVVIAVVVVAAVGALFVVRARSNEDPDPAAGSTGTTSAPFADRVTCAAWHRPDDRVPPTADGEISIDLTEPGEDHQSLEAGDFTLVIDFSWDRAFSGEGRSFGVSVSDQVGNPIVSHLYQISSGPIDQFDGDHGFTGLVYVTHPTTGAELQYICQAS